MQNWAKNITFSSQNFIEIENITQLQKVIESSNKLKVVGTGHSFSEIADTTGTLISLKNLDPEIEIDEKSQTVKVAAGTSYANLAKYLEKNGWAISNLASLGEITIAGAIMTGTHGSGSNNKVLSDSVVAIEMILASGDKFVIDRKDFAQFPGFVVSFGALAVFTKLTLKIVKSFSVKQVVYENIPIQSILENFNEIFDKPYSASYFNNWSPKNTGQIWMKFLDNDKFPELQSNAYGGNLAKTNQHPVKVNHPDNCTEQMGVAGKWLFRLPHFKLDSSPASGDEVQTEYLVDRKHVQSYINELIKIGEDIAVRVYATEIRTISSDDLWLSGAYERETVGFHFTWKKSSEIKEFLPVIENILGKNNGRPHWGKLFSTTKAQLIERYPKYEEFRNLIHKYDSGNKFGNKFIEQYF
jgi:xylitol oxidase